MEDLKPTIFVHESLKEIRAFDDGKDFWFVAKDVCNMLGIRNSRDAVQRLDEDESKTVETTDTLGRRKRMHVVNESGMYHLIFISRKPEAKAFRKWVTSEVLPELRKHGVYAINKRSQLRMIEDWQEHIRKILPEVARRYPNQ